MACRAAVAFVFLGTISCSRVRDVPRRELPKLSPHPTSPTRATGPCNIEGRKACAHRIVLARGGHAAGLPGRALLLRCGRAPVDRVQSIRFLSDRVELVGLQGRRRPQHVTRVVALNDSERWARISERSSSRGLIIAGVAVGVGLAVGIKVSAIVSANDSDPHGLRAILAGGVSAAAAGGTTLIFTVPATRDLGSEVE
jgi:hypothetical protein